jgi:hypothetical protein
MADIDTATQAQADPAVSGDPVENIKSAFLEHSQVKPNGVREVNKAGFSAAMLSVGVSGEDFKRVTNAIDNATTAAALIAEEDLHDKIGGLSKDELSNDETRRGLSTTVRLPTPGGKTEVTVSAETVNNIPFRGDADGNGERQTKTTHGRIRVSVNATGRIQKDLPGAMGDRIKSKLGL